MTDEPIRYKISDKIWHRISDAFNKAAAYIHRKGEYKAEYLTDKEVKPLIDETYKAFSEAVDYGLKDNEIPTAMRMYLQDNVFVFSGFKTHTELRQASALLRDASGQIKPFNRFLTDIQKIDKDYNKTYLQAEYNFAVASSQAAARWQEFAADGDDFLLQYRTAKDEKVREQHRLLDGITLPPSDKFWDEYFVPLGWNCRCSVVQVNPRRYPRSDSEEALQRGRAATYQPNAKGQNKAQIFRFNSGKQKVVFPPKHPYYPKGCGNCNLKQFKAGKGKPECEACKIIHNQSLEEIQKTFQGLEYKEKCSFAKNYLKENKVGKVFFSHPDFGNRKAEFVTGAIDEAIRQPAAFDIKFDILFNLENYLDPNAKLTIEPPKDGKDKARQFFVLTTKYKGANKSFKDKKVEILFRENQNRTINIHFVRLFFDE